MSSRKHQKLKRHPLIRLIRSILRLIRTVFRPKKRPARSIRSIVLDPVRPSNADNRLGSGSVEIAAELVIQPKDPFVETVGELFDLVQWQIPPVITQPISKIVVARTSSVSHVQHSSIATVGELLGQVKWQLSPATGQQSSNPSPMVRTFDVSRN
ncbi:hypothetical protein [Chamaesiphon sp.]|uniref:hypothetical protein n=1 Tax=Chamaesiphon sp. TaxID=2814140 RepID=UPI003593E09F